MEWNHTSAKTLSVDWQGSLSLILQLLLDNYFGINNELTVNKVFNPPHAWSKAAEGRGCTGKADLTNGNSAITNFMFRRD